MLRLENLETLIGETASDIQIKPRPTNNCNKRGMQVERDMSKLLGALDYVLWVRQTKKDEIEDRHKIDLVVGLDQSKKELSIPEVSVQVKASTTGVITFKRKIVKILKSDKSEEKISRKEWMLRNQIVLLAGDVRISRSRKTRWPITNEEIITSFESQLKNIDDYRRLNGAGSKS